jgi:hypothetical protein
MKPNDILEGIVAHNGNCNWVEDHTDPKSICAKCPMSKLKQDERGFNLSCVESIGGDKDLEPHELDALYLIKAKKMLIDQEIDKILRK